MISIRTRTILAMSAALLTVTACKKSDTSDSSSSTPSAMTPMPAPPAAATALSMYTGRRIGDNKQISDSTSMFGVRDTMYVVVTTDNTPSGGNMMARWTYETGQVVDSVTQQVDRTDNTNMTAITEFHVWKATPWPAGKYTVDVMLDGRMLGSKTVEVKMK